MLSLAYRVFDLLNKSYWGSLNLNQVTFEKKLNGAGTFRGELPFGEGNLVSRSLFAPALTGLDNEAGYGMSQLLIQRAGSLLLVIESNGVPEWFGIIEKVTPWLSNQQIELDGTEVWNYFGQRALKADKDYSATPTDQTQIFKDMIDWAQSTTNGNIGVDTSKIPTTGQLITPAKYAAADRKTIASICEDLSKAANGFDFRIDGYMDPNSRLPVLWANVGYPYLGTSATETPEKIIRFNSPGNIIDFEYQVDGTQADTDVDVTAHQGTGDTLIQSARNQDLIDEGFAARDYTWTADNVFTTTTDGRMQAAANGLAQVFDGPVNLPTIKVRPEYVVGYVNQGDDVRIVIEHPILPGGKIDKYFRVTDISIDVDQQEADLTLDAMNSAALIEGSQAG